MSKARILIVEDESIVAEDIRFSLEAHEYEVVGVCSDGAEALRLATRLKPDLALMDIRIEGETDGIATAARFWDELRIPVVFLTAHSDAATLERAKASRPFAYLLKPFQERELCVTVEIALSKRPGAPMLELPASRWYGAIQLALSAADFQAELGPDACLRLASPHGASLDDRSADILDIATAIWLQQAENPQSLVALRADDCLSWRGLQRQKSGSGQRGGYEDKWRQEVAEQLNLLAKIALATPAGSEPLLVCEAAGAYAWRMRPAQALTEAWFDPLRRASVPFSQKILTYDPYRQKWEKRLARRQAWQGVSDMPLGELIQALGLPLDTKNPIRTKERLETALTTLRSDGLIAAWEFTDADPAMVGKRGWLALWLGWRLSLRAPRPPESTQAIPKARAQRQRSFAFIRQIRTERGLSQAEVATAIGITQAQLSQIESGSKVQAATADRIKAWILAEL